MEQFGAGQIGQEDNLDFLFFTPQQVVDTPSRAEGMSADKERHERFRACKLARELVRKLLDEGGTPKKDQRELAERAQALACYYLQLYFMHYAIDDGLQVEKERQFCAESPQVVALAAVLLACKVSDRPQRMKELVRAHANVRVNEGFTELAEEESREFQRRVPDVEFDLLRIISFQFDLPMPQDMIDELVRGFVDKYKGFGYIKLQTQAELDSFTKKLQRKAQQFVNDSFQGVCPLLVPPRVLSAAAVNLAMRFLDRGAKVEHICESLQAVDSRLTNEEVKKGQEELVNVFRTASEIKKMAPENGKPAQVPAALGGKVPPANATATAGSLAKANPQEPKACVNQDQGQLTLEKAATVPVQVPQSHSKCKDGGAATGGNGAGTLILSAVSNLPVTKITGVANSPIRSTGKLSEMRARPYAPQKYLRV